MDKGGAYNAQAIDKTPSAGNPDPDPSGDGDPGPPGTQTPAFGLRLSPNEVWQVHAFIKSTEHC